MKKKNTFSNDLLAFASVFFLFTPIGRDFLLTHQSIFQSLCNVVYWDFVCPKITRKLQSAECNFYKAQFSHRAFTTLNSVISIYAHFL